MPRSNWLVGLDVVIGLAISVALHTLQIAIAALISVVACIAEPKNDYCVLTGAIALLFVGVTQLVYMGPAIGLVFWRGRRTIAIGMVVGASLTFLLNAACWAPLGFSGLFG